MAWRRIRETTPLKRGWYCVWRVADEGEGFAPAEWMGAELWDGAWESGDWGIVKFWDVPYATVDEAARATLTLKRPA